MPDKPATLDYQSKPVTLRRPWRLSYPNDLFTLVRTASIAVTVLALFGPSCGFRLFYAWYIDISTDGILLMQLHPNYAHHLSLFPLNSRPYVINTMLSYPHWPYAHWITIPLWLAIPVWISAFVLLWRATSPRKGTRAFRQ